MVAHHLVDVGAVEVGAGGGSIAWIDDVGALKVGPRGKVVGVDMTDEQRAKAERLRDRDGFLNVTYVKGYIEQAPLPDGLADLVISNGVINLCADKRRVFGEVMRALKPGGRLQFADIANSKPVPEAAIRNIDLWTD